MTFVNQGAIETPSTWNEILKFAQFFLGLLAGVVGSLIVAVLSWKQYRSRQSEENKSIYREHLQNLRKKISKVKYMIKQEQDRIIYNSYMKEEDRREQTVEFINEGLKLQAQIDMICVLYAPQIAYRVQKVQLALLGALDRLNDAEMSLTNENIEEAREKANLIWPIIFEEIENLDDEIRTLAKKYMPML